mgnify:FL=1|tara:strand:+ start:2020 stop:3159 length:1140 start_codon:yes stop_codon:yes gene_type:complete
MATFNSASKSSRLLQSKRYTILPSDFQEAYTSVLDINASEIYTEEGGIVSSNLPFSGSSQDGNILVSGSSNILKYFYKLELSPSDTITSGKYLTWFAITGSVNGESSRGYYSASSAQVIQNDQGTNWISNKYAIPSLAGNKAETPGSNPGTPGYNIYLQKGSSPVDVTQVDDADYQFDYKTGVIQYINESNAPNAQSSAGTNRLYLSGYQYIGQTLDQFISLGSGGGSGDGFPFSGSAQITGSLNITGSGIIIDSNSDTPSLTFKESGLVSGAVKTSGGNLIFDASSGTEQARITPAGNFGIGTPTPSEKLTVAGNALITGSLTITSSLNDIFLIKSGSVDLLKMSSSGALVFADLPTAPSPVAGGMFYSSSNFYVGVE